MSKLRTQAEYVAQMKQEILADIKAGIQPADVADYSTLHDHVDANEYGGFCSDDLFSGTDEETDAVMEMAGKCQDEVHEWLKAGRPADE